ncbi:RNA polymerase sigma-70 factor, ECF subfamily [Mucilaginibacter mallensis]|uniref:RNA polymerase sigma-70 factor, ECF subfamily n=1 Tax=Mucilaginibacter mallensis TaxID=652787 RepID=A0A1H2C053_MUCMA|nr:RNA polymerase sigma factor [Mucilaginibacter mallensis]SDT63724.1 RNA polymerase sigma-70 factor, ECF subfamily [Mucilaginibacter mallensis]
MDLSKKQVTKLVEGCIGNERTAQETLYRHFYAQMLRICYRYLKTKDLAQEAVNEGFLKIFQHIKTYDAQKGDLGAWVCTIIIRTAIDYNRKELKFFTEDYNDQDTDEYFIDPDILSKLYAADLLKTIQQLPDATRVIFNLSVIDGYSHKEISTQLNITEGTSRWHLADGKKKLRAWLASPDNSLQPTDNTAI